MIIKNFGTISSNTTLNLSDIDKFNIKDLYRYYCLTLLKDKYYNIRCTNKELANLTGEKDTTLKYFTTKIANHIIKKTFCISYNGLLRRKSLYKIPDIEDSYITISKNFLLYEIDNKIKGYYLALNLLSDNGTIKISKNRLKDILHLSKTSIYKYNIELISIDAISINKGIITILPNGFILSNDNAVKKYISDKARIQNFVDNINLKL